MSAMTRRRFVKTTAALAPLALVDLKASAQSSTTGRRADERFDFVVAGAGHNSLICAAYLAKAGFSVLVLEGRPTIGGGCKTAEICLTGFRQDLCSTAQFLIQSNPLLRNNELGLRDYGLEYIDPDPVMHIPFLDGASITVWRDLERTCSSIARLSRTDAQTFRRLAQQRREFLNLPTDERAKSPQAQFWDRVAAMSGYDAARELYESDYLRAASLSCGRFIGVPGGDPGTGLQALSLVHQVLIGRPVPKGGSGMLTTALGRVLEKHNAVILTSKPVVRLIVERGRCAGVECADGSQYRADKAVISTIHAKQLIDMAPRELWGDDFLSGVQLLQPEHAMFVFHYALKEAPRYPLAEGGTIESCEAALMNRPERILRLNYDNARGEVNLDDLPLQVVCESVADPSRVPPGFATLKIEGTLPYALKEGPQHWDVIKEKVAESLLGYVRKFTPNITSDKVLAKFLLSPLDIERMNPAMWRGTVHHVDPRFGHVPYRMPIPGLYQTGACTPPGGSITGQPGRNAAAVVLKDFGTSLDAVVGTKVS
jgi:phytoene dehydrogenase-like protein